MNILKGLENIEHSTVKWFATEYQKLYKDLPAIDALADRVCPWAKLLLQTVVTAEAGAPAGAVVAAVVQSAVTDLDVANATITDVGATPTIASTISAVQSNLSGLLSAGQVKNANSQATVTKVVSELGSLAQAVTNALPPASPATSATTGS